MQKYLSTMDSIQNEHIIGSEYISSLFRNDQFSDVKLIFSDGFRIPAHRVILSIYSPVFRAMMSTQMIEAVDREISIVDIDPKILELLIRYMYTGAINFENLSMSDFYQLLDVSVKYDVANMIRICEGQLIQRVNIENVADALAFADLYGLKGLWDTALDCCSEEPRLVLSMPSMVALKENDPILFQKLLDIEDSPFKPVKAFVFGAVVSTTKTFNKPTWYLEHENDVRQPLWTDPESYAQGMKMFRDFQRSLNMRLLTKCDRHLDTIEYSQNVSDTFSSTGAVDGAGTDDDDNSFSDTCSLEFPVMTSSDSIASRSSSVLTPRPPEASFGQSAWASHFSLTPLPLTAAVRPTPYLQQARSGDFVYDEWRRRTMQVDITVPVFKRTLFVPALQSAFDTSRHYNVQESTGLTPTVCEGTMRSSHDLNEAQLQTLRRVQRSRIHVQECEDKLEGAQAGLEEAERKLMEAREIYRTTVKGAMRVTHTLFARSRHHGDITAADTTLADGLRAFSEVFGGGGPAHANGGTVGSISLSVSSMTDSSSLSSPTNVPSSLSSSYSYSSSSSSCVSSSSWSSSSLPANSFASSPSPGSVSSPSPGGSTVTSTYLPTPPMHSRKFPQSSSFSGREIGITGTSSNGPISPPQLPLLFPSSSSSTGSSHVLTSIDADDGARSLKQESTTPTHEPLAPRSTVIGGGEPYRVAANETRGGTRSKGGEISPGSREVGGAIGAESGPDVSSLVGGEEFLSDVAAADRYGYGGLQPARPAVSPNIKNVSPRFHTPESASPPSSCSGSAQSPPTEGAPSPSRLNDVLYGLRSSPPPSSSSSTSYQPQGSSARHLSSVNGISRGGIGGGVGGRFISTQGIGIRPSLQPPGESRTAAITMDDLLALATGSSGTGINVSGPGITQAAVEDLEYVDDQGLLEESGGDSAASDAGNGNESHDSW